MARCPLPNLAWTPDWRRVNDGWRRHVGSSKQGWTSTKPKPIRTLSIIPALPEQLKPLLTLAYNLRWSWKYDVIELFMWMDSELWEETHHNPVRMLGMIDQARLDRLAG